MVNKVTLIGRLGRDPEHGSSQSGKSYCRFVLATDGGFGDTKKTEWHSVICFGAVADNAQKRLHKGAMCYIDGRIVYESYERDGVKRTSAKIVANTVFGIGGGTVHSGDQPKPDTSDNDLAASFDEVPF